MISKLVSFEVNTRGENDFVDITSKLREVVMSAGIASGIASVSVRSTTSSVAICENERGLLEDMKRALSRAAPDNMEYEHNEAYHDGNGRSHIKSTMVGQGIVVPVRDSDLLLGTWQAVFLMEFDVRPRRRPVDVQLLG